MSSRLPSLLGEVGEGGVEKYLRRCFPIGTEGIRKCPCNCHPIGGQQ